MDNFEKVIKTYLDQFANNDEQFNAKYDSNKISDCCKYIMSEAKKESKGNCAVLSDGKVYGLAVHFFDEGIKIENVNIVNARALQAGNVPAPKKVDKKAKKVVLKAAEEQDNNQLSLF